MDNFICAIVSDQSILYWRPFWKQEFEPIPMTRSFFDRFELVLSGTVVDDDGSRVNGSREVRLEIEIKRLKWSSVSE
jgi:hypothetical protein